MTRRYDFTTSRGFLTGIKITTEEHVRSNELDKKWINADFIELLLLIECVEDASSNHQAIRILENAS